MSDRRKNWYRYFLWWTDLLTEFQQGAIRGLLPGTGGGAGSAGVAKANSDLDASTLATIGVGAFVSMVVANGISNAVVWARANPIPNPLRPPPQK